MKKNVLLLGLMVFVLGTITSFAQTVNGPGVFGTYMEDFEDGEAQGWTPLDGPWTVTTNTAVGTGGNWYNMNEGEVMRHSIYNEATFENYTISADIYPGWANKTGIIFNYQDEDNFYYVEHLGYAKTMYLRQKVDGIWDHGNYNDVEVGYGWAPDSTFWNTPGWENRIDTAVQSEWIETAEFYNTMKIKNSEGLTTVWFNDVEVFSDVQTPEFTSGKVGIFTHWCPVFVDNFKVESNANITAITDRETNNDVLIFPNPVNSQVFSIRLNGYGPDIKVNIYDIWGKLVFSRNSKGQEFINIHVDEFNAKSGLYIINITSGRKIYTGK